MQIEGYRVDSLHTFQVRTLRSLGFRTRVALSNGSDADPRFATEYRVDLSVYGPTRQRISTHEGIARLVPGDRIVLDTEPYVADFAADVVLIFHLIPLRLLPQAKDGLLDVSREELYFLFTVKDHYVEYYREDGFAAGVLYQSGAFNYPKFSREASSIIQAPKGYVSSTVDTLISLMNSSPDPDYARTAELKCALRSADGKHALTWTEKVAAFEPALISLRKKSVEMGMTPSAAPSFYSFYAVCEGSTLVPLTFNINDKTGAVGVEHSLPPLYYSNMIWGPRRAKMVREFADSPLFTATGGR